MYPSIDWNRVWQETQQENLNIRKSSRCSAYWDSEQRASDYLRTSRTGGGDRIRTMIQALDITPESRILDIGSGPGTLALPLAPMVSRITAVEPAAHMVARLREEIRQNSVTNISIVEKHWEDLAIPDLQPPYDGVIAAYSLGMPDLKGALMKMQEVCSGTVYIFYAAGKPFWEEMMVYLWPHLHNTSYQPGPKADVIWNLLYQMGICANIAVTPIIQRNRYKGLEEAVAEYAPRMLITEEWQRDLLSQYIRNRLLICDGDYCLTGTVLHTCISWKA